MTNSKIAFARKFMLLVALSTAATMGLSLTALRASAGQPEISSQPAPQAAVVGGRAIFTVMAQGTGPLIFQWRKDGMDIANATNDTLFLSNVQSADAGQYSVRVSDDAASTASADAALLVSTPQAGDVDFLFDSGSGINGPINSMAIQPDGKLLIAGTFTTVAGAVRHGLARLNIDLSTDHTFMNGMSGADGDINTLDLYGSEIASVALQLDGKVVIGGNFPSVNGKDRIGIARLKADGSLDNGFNPGTGANDRVAAVVMQTNGKILVGGWFTRVNGTNRNYIARLNVDGSLDTGFNAAPIANGALASVDLVAVQTNGQVLIAGQFSSVNGTNRSGIARLNANGSLDTTFNPNVRDNFGGLGSVDSVALQTNGQVLIAGRFSSVNGTNRSGIARLNANGSLDTTFDPDAGANGNVSSVALQLDGKVLIGGSFLQVKGTDRSRIARLNTDGSLDTGFDPGSGPDGSVYRVVSQPDGKVLIDGSFKSVNRTNRNSLARLNADGSLAPEFTQSRGPDNSVDSIAPQPDGRILIGGAFTSIEGTTQVGLRRGLARLLTDGTRDSGFNPPPSVSDFDVYSIALQSNGKVVVGGHFSYFLTNPQSVGNEFTYRNNIARFNADGSLDTSFNAEAGGIIYSVALQSDGKVLVGGQFGSFN